MTRDEFLEYHKEFCAMMQNISSKKNADYTGGSDIDDAFTNFKSVETLGIPVEVGFLTRMMDKMARIGTFIKKGHLQVKDESFEDTCLDLANYAVLLSGYRKSLKQEKK